MESQGLTNKISSMFYAAKALALYSIILAHSSYTSIKNDFAATLFGHLSTVGVVAFLFTSGFFFKQSV